MQRFGIKSPELSAQIEVLITFGVKLIGSRGLRLKRGSLLFAAGRATSVLSQIALAGAASRLLSLEELGRFTAAVATSNAFSLLFGLSVRRLTMRRDPEENLSDLKVASIIGAILILVCSAAFCGLLYDSYTATLALCFAGWRAADTYSEIGQGCYCFDNELGKAGIFVAIRCSISTIIATVLLAYGSLLSALAIGAVIRAVLAVLETERARRRGIQAVEVRAVAESFRVGMYYSSVPLIIALVDNLPTVIIANTAGFDVAAILTPLGRIRYGLTIVATTVAEAYYADMVRARQDARSVLGVARQSLAQFAVLALVSGLFIALGGAALIFGSIVEGRGALVVLSLVAGAIMGINILISIGLTAQEKIRVQLVGYAISVVVVLLAMWFAGWALESLYLGQLIAGVVSVAIFIWYGYGIRVNLRGHKALSSWSRPVDG